MIDKTLFKLAKGKFLGNMVGLIFQYLSFTLPVKKVFRSKKILGFYHPKPSYKKHILVIPKKNIKNLIELSKHNNIKYLLEIWNSSKKIASKCFGENSLYVLCANGGKRQEVQQVHFHLFKDEKIVNTCIKLNDLKTVYSNKDINIMYNTNSNWETHLIMAPWYYDVNKELDKQININDLLISSIKSIPSLDLKFALVKNGYTFIYQENFGDMEKVSPILHLVSGKRLYKA